jgi:hypothetical protein
MHCCATGQEVHPSHRIEGGPRSTTTNLLRVRMIEPPGALDSRANDPMRVCPRTRCNIRHAHTSYRCEDSARACRHVCTHHSRCSKGSHSLLTKDVCRQSLQEPHLLLNAGTSLLIPVFSDCWVSTGGNTDTRPNGSRVLPPATAHTFAPMSISARLAHDRDLLTTFARTSIKLPTPSLATGSKRSPVSLASWSTS